MTIDNWFDKQDIDLSNLIISQDIRGYVLPHASTKYTGQIISHTLRFKPIALITQIIIIFFPSAEEEDIFYDGTPYHHEFLVPWQALLIALAKWNISTNSVQIIPINVRKLTQKYSNKELNLDNSLFVISSDFSHFLPMETALELENTSARALMFKNTNDFLVNNVVDDPMSYEFFFELIKRYPRFKDITLQWIGRTRSSGLRGVGYLSFLILNQHIVTKPPDGIFVTCYDGSLRPRECLGNWFSSSDRYSLQVEETLIKKVIKFGGTTSRLTGGNFTNHPIQYYTVSYLYRSEIQNTFIRGFHTVLGNATYLADVFLENTFENGKWIRPTDKEWPPNNKSNNFDMTDTIHQLNEKSHTTKEQPLVFYDTFVKHVSITKSHEGGKKKKSKRRKKRKNKTIKKVLKKNV
jgi:hypothetical protein